MQELCKAVVCLGDAFICMLMSVLLTMPLLGLQLDF